MDAYRAIVTKRDTRHYDDRPISEDALQRILQAGRMAGSSKNTQPVRFVVLRDPERKAAIASCGHYAEHVPHCAAAICVVLVPGGGPFDAGRAAQNMMVAAWAEGITSCPTSMHEAERAREVLGLPPDHTVAICLSMGYPAPGKPIGAGRQRMPLDELVHWERW
jgi:nitroreductase